ncbi:MAG: tyrosine-type recombinase/integrase [Verrucomicrobiota bacterium]
MKVKFRLFQRASGAFYIEDTFTKQQTSLRTKDKYIAQRLLLAKNEAFAQPVLNLEIARVHLAASDPAMGKRTWQDVMEAIIKTKTDQTKTRWRRAIDDRAFELIRNLKVMETGAHHFLKVLDAGTVATNAYLKTIHNFALNLGWLPIPIVPRKLWPKVQFKERRAITLDEHNRIVERERNPELKAFYLLLWHLGGSQSDIANLRAEDVDWNEKVISYRRLKTKTLCMVRFGENLARILETLPKSGLFLPRLSRMKEKHRAKEFKRRCKGLGISGITLHSYRYAWAERAKEAGYPERFAQEALGHNSKAVHRAYAKKVQVKLPSLEEFEAKNLSISATL